MLTSTPSTHRPSYTPAARDFAPAAHATPDRPLQLQLPPGLRALHVKENLPRSVLERLDERSPSPPAEQRRLAARALIDGHLAAGGGVPRGSALRA